MSLKNLNFSAVCLMACLLSTVTSPGISANPQPIQVQQNTLWKDKASYRYNLGKKLWSCLREGCVIFSGTVRAVVDPEVQETGYDMTQFYGKIVMDVDEWIGKKPSNLERTVEFDHALGPVPRSDGSPAQVWHGIELSVGMKLLIVLWGEKAQRPVRGDKPEQVAIVVPELDLFDEFREITNQDQLFEQSPEKFIEACQEIIARDKNDLFLGYFMEYLHWKVETVDIEKAVSIYVSLFNKKDVSDDVWHHTPFTCVRGFTKLSDKTRDMLVRTLIRAAAGENLERARSAIAALTWEEKVLVPLKPFATPHELEKIAQTYRELVSTDKMTKCLEFEEQLGLKPTN